MEGIYHNYVRKGLWIGWDETGEKWFGATHLKNNKLEGHAIFYYKIGGIKQSEETYKYFPGSDHVMPIGYWQAWCKGKLAIVVKYGKNKRVSYIMSPEQIREQNCYLPIDRY